MTKKKKKENQEAMKKIGSSVFILFLLLFTSPLWAANIKVEASVDRNQMGIGESFTLNLAVQSDGDMDSVELVMPQVPGVEVINVVSGGRQSSSSMTIINGKTQFIQRTSQSFSLIMSPQKEGTYLIPGVDVKVDGQMYKSNPVKIEVKEEYRNSRAKQPKGRPRFPPGYGGQIKSSSDKMAEQMGFKKSK